MRNDSIIVIELDTVEDHIFTYTSMDGWEYNWNVTRARRIAEERDDLQPISLNDFGFTLAFIRSQYSELNEAYAMTTDLTKPLLFAPLVDKICLIDGWHRLFRAVSETVDILPAYFLTQAEADQALVCALPPNGDVQWGYPTSYPAPHNR